MISTKSPREIELMRIAGDIVAQAHEAVKIALCAGMTTSS